MSRAAAGGRIGRRTLVNVGRDPGSLSSMWREKLRLQCPVDLGCLLEREYRREEVVQLRHLVVQRCVPAYPLRAGYQGVRKVSRGSPSTASSMKTSQLPIACLELMTRRTIDRWNTRDSCRMVFPIHADANVPTALMIVRRRRANTMTTTTTTMAAGTKKKGWTTGGGLLHRRCCVVDVARLRSFPRVQSSSFNNQLV